MSTNWKRGLLLGIVIFLYILAAQKLWPDLNVFFNALIGAAVGWLGYKVGDFIFPN